MLLSTFIPFLIVPVALAAPITKYPKHAQPAFGPGFSEDIKWADYQDQIVKSPVPWDDAPGSNNGIVNPVEPDYPDVTRLHDMRRRGNEDLPVFDPEKYRLPHTHIPDTFDPEDPESQPWADMFHKREVDDNTRMRHYWDRPTVNTASAEIDD